MYELEVPLFPKNKAQLCLDLFYDMDLDQSKYDACMMEDEAFSVILEEYMERMDNIEFNMEHHISEWKFTNRQKEQIVTYFKEEKNLRKAGTEKQKVFKKVLEELCEAGNLRAIQIKGYACYGDGHPVYPCDWFVSRDCMLQLVEHGDDHMQAQSANTLGYIYYHGRCNNGIPEYDLAYKYFSLASFYGFYEASYKIGDMLAGGKGIPKNKRAAYRLYEKVYMDCYRKFQEDDKHQTLADAALRMGKAYQTGIGVYPNLMLAYTYYLQAKLAIGIRMKHSDFFGNKKVLAGIEKGLEETRLELLKEKDVTQSHMMIDIKRIVDVLRYDPYVLRTITMKIQNDDDAIRLKFKRRKIESYDPISKIMITVPEVSYCKRTNQIVLQCPKDTEINVKNDAKKIAFNEMKVVNDHVNLYLHGKRRATIRCIEMLFDVENQK